MIQCYQTSLNPEFSENMLIIPDSCIHCVIHVFFYHFVEEKRPKVKKPKIEFPVYEPSISDVTFAAPYDQGTSIEDIEDQMDDWLEEKKSQRKKVRTSLQHFTPTEVNRKSTINRFQSVLLLILCSRHRSGQRRTSAS